MSVAQFGRRDSRGALQLPRGGSRLESSASLIAAGSVLESSASYNACVTAEVSMRPSSGMTDRREAWMEASGARR